MEECVGHRDLGKLKPVYAAGEIRTTAGIITEINNESGCYHPQSLNLERLQKSVFEKHGFREVLVESVCGIDNYYDGFDIGNINHDRTVTNNIPLGITAFANKNNEHRDFNLLPAAFAQVANTQQQVQANTAARNPNISFQTALQAHAEVNNPSFRINNKPWQQYLPSWVALNNEFNRIVKPKPTEAELKFHIQQELFFRPRSEWDLRSGIESTFGLPSTGYHLNLLLNSLHGNVVGLPNGMWCSSSISAAQANIYSLSSFASLLSMTGLSSSYNMYHGTYMFNHLLRTIGKIGGVAVSAATIKGPIDFDSHVFAIKANADGKMPFSDAQLKQICAELKRGIFEHNTYPFFSLHFNNDGNLYPVIHPAYQNTLVGEVIGLLDYYMKALFHGGMYLAEFLQTWHLAPNRDLNYLKAKLIDIKSMNENFVSLQEKICLADLERDASDTNTEPFSVKAGHYQTSFRIIAKQKGVAQDKNLLMFESDYDVEYTVDVLPAYQEYLDKYRSEHGNYPEDYLKLHSIYQAFTKTIKEELPKLPLGRDYFEMLGVINLPCYYYHILKITGKEPVVGDVANANHSSSPKMLPPLPVRYFQKHKIAVTAKDLIDQLNAKAPGKLDDFMHQQFLQDGNDECPQNLRDNFYTAIHQNISSQVGATDLDKKRVNMLADESVAFFQDLSLGLINQEISSCLGLVNRSLLKSLRGKDDTKPVPERYNQIKIDEKAVDTKESFKDKFAYIKRQVINSMAEMKKDELGAIDRQLLEVIRQIPGNKAKTTEEFVAQVRTTEADEEKRIASLNDQVEKLSQEIEDNKQKQIEACNSQTNEFIATTSANKRRAYEKNINDEVDKIRHLVRNPDDCDDVKNFKSRVRSACNNDIAAFFNEAEEERKEVLHAIEQSAASQIESFKNQLNEQTASSALTISTLNDLINQTVKLKADCEENILKFQTALLDEQTKIEKGLATMSSKLPGDLPIIDTIFLHSVIDVNGHAQSATHVVGGCGVDLHDITPTQINDQGLLHAKATANAKKTSFSRFSHNGQDYYIFKISTQLLKEQQQHITQGIDSENLIKDQGYSPLMVAVLASDKEEITKRLNDNNFNNLLPNGMTALYLAIQIGDTETAMLLLNSGKPIDINIAPDNGVTPLHLALQNDLDSVATTLIEMGANLYAKRKVDDYMPIHVAASLGKTEHVKDMVELWGFDVDMPVPSSGKTALHLAVSKGWSHLLIYLKEVKADFGTQDINGNTPINEAVLEKDTLMLSRMLNYTSSEKNVSSGRVNNAGETLALLAAKSDNALIHHIFAHATKADQEAKDKDGYDCLYYFAKHGQYHLIRKHEEGFDLNAIYDGKSVLAIAAEHGHNLLVDYLLEKKAVYRASSNTLVKNMIAMNDPSYIKYNTYPRKISPAQQLKAAIEYGSAKCLNFLLSLITKDNIRQVLTDAIHAGDPDIFATIWHHAERRKINVKDITLDDKTGDSAIHISTKFGRIEILKLLRGYGSKLNDVNKRGTIYPIASKYKDSKMLELFKKWEVKETNNADLKLLEIFGGWKVKDSEHTKKTEDAQQNVGKEAPKPQAENITRALQRGNFKQLIKELNSLPNDSLINQAPIIHYALLVNSKRRGNFAKQILKYLASKKVDPLLKDGIGNPLSFTLLEAIDVEDAKTKLEWLNEFFPNKFKAILAQTNAGSDTLIEAAIKTGNMKIFDALNHQPSSIKSRFTPCGSFWQ